MPALRRAYALSLETESQVSSGLVWPSVGLSFSKYKIEDPHVKLCWLTLQMRRFRRGFSTPLSCLVQFWNQQSPNIFSGPQHPIFCGPSVFSQAFPSSSVCSLEGWVWLTEGSIMSLTHSVPCHCPRRPGELLLELITGKTPVAAVFPGAWHFLQWTPN